MSNTNKTEQAPGPFKDKHTKTIKVSPIEITISEERDSTHVPPKDCGCGGGASLSDIVQAAQQYAAQAASSSQTFDGEGNPR